MVPRSRPPVHRAASWALLAPLAALLATPDAPAQPAADPPAAPAAPAADATLPTLKASASAIASPSPLGSLARRSDSGALGSKAVLDTPFSITVVGSDEIVQRGATSIGQIFFNDPSVYTPTTASSTDWWGTQIRGLPVRNTYVDDVPMLLHWGGGFPIEVVDSVTALKGLSGFMYGFGEPGGALSYQLKRPTASAETSVLMGYRNPRLFSAHVDTSHLLGDGLALRANVATEQGTAYNASHLDRVVASLAVDRQIGASLKWLGTFVHEDSKTRGEPLQFYLDGYDVAGSGGQLPAVTQAYDDINVDNAYYASKTTLATSSLVWRIDEGWSLKGQIGLSRKEHRSNKAFANLLNRDGDYSGHMYNFAGRLDTLFSQLMLQGRARAGGLAHEIVGGLGLQRSKDRWGHEWYWENDFDGNLFVAQPFRTTRTPDFSLAPVSADTVQTYAFVSDTVHLGDRWQLIAGVRFTDHDLKDLDGDPTIDSGSRTRRASPTLAAVYKPDAGTSVYASFVEGVEAGTRVEAPYANAGEVLGATVSRQVEIGIKHAAGAIDYSGALFRVRRANAMDVLRGSDRFLSQDGLVVYQGAEVSGAWRASRNLELGVGAIYLDATIDRVSADNAALQGNTPSNAPRWQVVGNASYRVPALPGLQLHGGLRYFGASFVADDNRLTVPGRTVVDAGFSHDFRLRGQDLTLIGNLHNVFNRKYWASGGWSAGNVGEARNLSLTLSATF